jgi:hypothetical protein
MFVTRVRIATEIPAAIRAYSIEVAAFFVIERTLYEPHTVPFTAISTSVQNYFVGASKLLIFITSREH